MKIERSTIYSAGSCNFCDKGELTAGGYGLHYPYQHVFNLSGRAIAVRVCDNCLQELNDFARKIYAKEIADKLSRDEDID